MDDLGTSKTLNGAPPPTVDLPNSLPLQSPRTRQRRQAEARVQALDASSENHRRHRHRASSGHAKSLGTQRAIASVAGASCGESFRVGDLVWGELKISSWWPGKVLDPTSERSAKAKKHREDQRLLVFFFGDGSVAWYEPSQLRPFRKEFKRMTEQNNSEGFVTAITDALAEVKDALDSEMRCFLGVGQEKGDIVSTYVLRPGEFLELAHDAARNILSINKLDATMLRCWTLVFRHWKDQLTEVDKNGMQNGGIRASINDKLEQECLVAETGSGTMRRPEISEEHKQRRKERSIAELIGTKKYEINDQNVNKNKVNFEEAATAGIVVATNTLAQSQSRKLKKRFQSKAISIVENDVNMVSDEKDFELEELNPSSSATHKRKKCDDINKGSGMKNGGSGASEETRYSRRERKMSRYLSPPYTNIGGYVNLSFSFKDEASEMQNETEAYQLPLIRSLQSTYVNNESMNTPLNLHEVSVQVILSKVISAAANPLCLKWNRSAKIVRHFFHKFRSVVYEEGSDSESYKKFMDKLSNESHISQVVNSGIHSGKAKSTGKKSRGNKVADTLVEPDHNSERIEYSRIRKISSNKSSSKSSASIERKSSNGSTEVEDNGKETGISGYGGKTKLHEEHVHGSSGNNCSSVGKTEVADAVDTRTLDDSLVSRTNKPNKKRKVLNEADGALVVDFDHKTLSSPQKTNSGKQGKKEVRTIYKSPVSLVLKFTPGTILPSKDEIISKHNVYGEVDQSHTEVLQDSLCAFVVFKRRIDAEKAVKSLYSDGNLVLSVSSYELHRWKENTSTKSPASKTPLPSIRTSLEKIISKLTGFTPPEEGGRSSNHLRSEVRDDLVGETNRLLKKVNKLLSGPSADT